jgi:SHS2 domain-containing protein
MVCRLLSMENMGRSTKLFREIEHTGDIGIEIDAGTRAELFRRAAIAIAQIMVEPANIRTAATRRLLIEGLKDEDLMHDMLGALLQLFLVDGFIWADANVEEGEEGLQVEVSGEAFDPQRHEFREEIKAVTYHQLTVHKNGDGWHARVIFDV